MPQTLTTEQRSELATRLRRRYRALWTDIRKELARSDAESYQATAGETQDFGDAALADLVVDINLADVHRDIVEMREIEAALGRVVDGSYGACSDCGDEIGLARLHANPAAQRCEACQRRYERLHLPTVGPSL